jgi:hypothetical protein
MDAIWGRNLFFTDRLAKSNLNVMMDRETIYYRQRFSPNLAGPWIPWPLVFQEDLFCCLKEADTLFTDN